MTVSEGERPYGEKTGRAAPVLHSRSVLVIEFEDDTLDGITTPSGGRVMVVSLYTWGMGLILYGIWGSGCEEKIWVRGVSLRPLAVGDSPPDY
jgi:hypothetical protein